MNYGAYASVRNWQTGLYDVYALPNPPLQMADPAYCTPGVRPTAIGVDISAAVCPLPPGARKVSTSPVAHGSVMRIGNGVPSTSGINVGAGVGIGGLGGGLGLGGTSGGGMGLGAIGQLVLAGVVTQIVTPLVMALIRGR